MGWPEYEALWKYDLLTEPLLSSELGRLAGAKSYQGTDCVTFQPCPNPEESSQDRYAVLDWTLRNGTWQFRAVLDGHGGHETVDYTLNALPAFVQGGLEKLINSEKTLSVDDVSQLLVDAISSVDDKITKDVLELFPDVTSFTDLSDDAIRAIINDKDLGGKNATVIARCMRGTTVLVSLLDPGRSNLWVASLGDCQAALGVHQPDGSWETLLLSSFHNGKNASEKELFSRDHPGEAECVIDDRVLGALAVTRAIGDHLFKLPVPYTERIFMNAEDGFRFSRNIQDFLWRNRTPPYVSNHADIQHIGLNGKNAILVMCSDGFLDLYAHSHMELAALADYWIQLLVATRARRSKDGTNMALCLLRDGLGGEDIDMVSRSMTVEMDSRWMDDTTILVHEVTGT
ncbi:hypothetical protein C0991_004928 [Blastosporella zonata]|nr:hypothetical protein C0991_004928 [Blastosporella zonata]